MAFSPGVRVAGLFVAGALALTTSAACGGGGGGEGDPGLRVEYVSGLTYRAKECQEALSKP